jgi:hypothetical protein
MPIGAALGGAPGEAFGLRAVFAVGLVLILGRRAPRPTTTGPAWLRPGRPTTTNRPLDMWMARHTIR